MEKQAVKAKKKFLAFLPKAAKAAKAAAALRIEFENPPMSPGKDHKRGTLNTANKHKPGHHQNRGYSGPITSVIFEEARSKSRLETREPTSPKISCIGQIKHTKKMSQKGTPKHGSLFKVMSFSALPQKSSGFKNTDQVMKKKEVKNNSRNLFSNTTKLEGRKSDASAEMSRLPDRAPSLSQMKRFASSRDALSNFDWTSATVTPVEEVNRHRRCHTDGLEEEEEVMGPFSEPLMVALEPKKEINLWKRRSMAPPKPLQLSTFT